MESSNQSSVTEFIFLAFAKSTRYPALFATIFLLLYLIIISGNILMILVIKADPHLHTPMYFFVFHLSCLDICYTTTVVPQTFCNLLNSRHSILFHNCVTQMFCMILFGALQILSITVMAYDRYVAIGNPLRYKIVMRWATCTMLLGITWITGFIITFILVYSVFRLPFCGISEIDHFYCDVGQVLLLTCPNTKSHRLSEFITFFTGFGLFTIPFLFLVTSYVYIISAILKIRTNEGRRKAFSTCSSHLTVVVVEYACLGFIYFRPSTAYSLDKDKVFVMTFTFVTPILNPVIYTVRNKAVKKGFMKLTSTMIF